MVKNADLVKLAMYRLTAITLLLMSVFITCNQFFGDPILCIKTNDIKKEIINNYCWIQGTFTLPRALIQDMELERKGLPPLKAGPGIDHRHKDDEYLVHNYYYWVCIVLFLQGCCFLVTRTLWKVWEKGYMKILIEDINKAIASQDKRLKRSIAITDFLNKRHFDLQSYSRKFCICEIINLLNVIFQIYITDVFLKGQFLRYGLDLAFIKTTVDPTNKVFPKLGKCTFRRFGSSGDVQTYDNLCILPLNIVNEKFYFVIWVLFFVVLVVSFWAVCIRIMLMVFKELRFHYIQVYNKHIDEQYFRSVLSNASYSYWFIIYLLSCNLAPMHFRDVILAIDFFKDHQVLPTTLIAWDVPLKKRLQNGSTLKKTDQKGELIVAVPDESKEIEMLPQDGSNETTLRRK